MPRSPKVRANRQLYLRALAAMTPQERLEKAFELTEWSRALSLAGLRLRFPELDEPRLRSLQVERLMKCRNRAS